MNEGTATFIAGGLGSFAFWIAAVPADNVKKCVLVFLIYILLTLLCSRVFGAPLDSSLTVRDAVRNIYQTAGWRGFYRGLAPSILRAFPSNACAYFVYEGVLRMLGAEKVRPPLYRTLRLMVEFRRGVRPYMYNLYCNAIDFTSVFALFLVR